MKLNDEIEVDIIRLNNEGEGVGLYNGIVTFVPLTLINEKVKARVTEIRDNYMRASLIEVLSKSNERTIPICPFYDKCGGCNLMHMNLESQLEFKKNKIKSVLKKICNIDIEVEDIDNKNIYNYRNKVVLRVEEDKIGFYRVKSNILVDITECLTLDKRINEVITKIREFIKENPNHNIKEVMIRNAEDEILLSIDNLNDNYKDLFIEKLNFISSIYINNELVYGVPSINQKIDDLVFDISPKSFFQINVKTASKMYEYALSKVSGSNVCVDLYSGTGTITMLLSKKARRVIGIESVASAVEDANNNLLLNGIDNVEFKLGKVENLIDELVDSNIDSLVLDPPRSGSDRKTLKTLLEIKPKQIIYISCNPVTFARDLNILKKQYKLVSIKPFDMFPNTSHVETVMILERKN